MIYDFFDADLNTADADCNLDELELDCNTCIHDIDSITIIEPEPELNYAERVGLLLDDICDLDNINIVKQPNWINKNYIARMK